MLLFPSPGDLADPGIKLISCAAGWKPKWKLHRWPSCPSVTFVQTNQWLDFPGGPAIKNLPSNVGKWVQPLAQEHPRYLKATKPVRHNYWVHTPQSPVLCGKRSPCSPELEKTHIQRQRPKIAKNKYINIYFIYICINGGWTSHVPHHPSPPQPFQVSRKGTQWFCVNSWSYKTASWLTVPDLHPSSTAVSAPSCSPRSPRIPVKLH